MKMRGKLSPEVFHAVIYLVAFVTGAIVMSFEMLGSRYLNPYFGSGIYTWAALISTVLAALTASYFLGGFIADRTVSAAILGMIVRVASVCLLVLPSFAGAILRKSFHTSCGCNAGGFQATSDSATASPSRLARNHRRELSARAADAAVWSRQASRQCHAAGTARVTGAPRHGRLA
jgi:hypothetical protein